MGSTALDAALAYISRGWSPVPIPTRSKNPGRGAWQKLRLTAETARQYFNGSPQNIGILLGGPSGDLVDVDLDHPLALKLADQFLPATEAVFGRPGNPRSHRIYQALSPIKTKKYVADSGKTTIVELRSTGGQTVFPPSIHESGELITWDDPDAMPSPVNSGMLQDAVLRLYNAVLTELGQAPQPGGRQQRETTGRIDDIEIARSALQSLDPSMVYDDWLHVGMALHATSESLLADWVAWSRGSDKFEDGLCERKWAGFVRGGPIQLGTLVRMAQTAGWQHPRKRTTQRSDLPSSGEGATKLAEPCTGSKTFYRLTDLGNSERLRDRHGGDLRFCHPWGKWHAFDGKRWREDDTGTVMKLAKATVRAMFEELGTIESDEMRRTFASHIIKSESAARLGAMEQLARSELPILPQEFDAHPMLLNCVNGTLDLRTGKLQQHRREDFLTKICPTAFDPEAPSYHFDRFLEAIFEGNLVFVDFLRRLLGYCLTGDVREQILAILHGTGSNGKSTLLNAVQNALGEDYCIKAKKDLLIVRKQEGHSTEMMDLFGKRLVIVNETDDGNRLAEGLVKDLTGGDSIRGRRMREDSWQYTPTHKIILPTNHKPTVRGTDHAIWRRLALVPFDVKFWNPDKGESGPAELRQDKGLAEKLKAEAPGILAWMVRGCLEWQHDGLRIPIEVQAATAEYRDSQDVLGAFIDECCLVRDGESVRASEIYGQYRRWMEDAGEMPVSQQRFGTAMTERGFERKKNNGKWYVGIEMKTATEPRNDSESLFGMNSS